MLCEHYGVERPRLGVGVVSGRSRGVLAVYSAQRKEILAASSDSLYDPFTILHEFYHHLRYFGSRHRGTEKHADRFALDYILAFRSQETKRNESRRSSQDFYGTSESAVEVSKQETKK